MSYKTRWGLAAALLAWVWEAGAVIGAVPAAPEVLQKNFPEIVRIQSGKEVCTGTIVGPRAVLSAAHCAALKNAFFEYRGQRYKITFASSQDYKAKEHDVAVAVTGRDIEGASFGSIGKGLRHGSTLYLAGYGCTERGGKSGALHMGAAKVIGMDEDHILSFSKNGGVLCQGDSGGPAFVRENGKHVLVAVNSAGDIQNINVNVRLDSALSLGFLKRVAERFKVAICGVTAVCDKSAAGPVQAVAQLGGS